MDRRDFITNIARGTILTGLGVISAVLLLKDTDSDTCDYQFICSKCKKLPECKLPEAAKYLSIQPR
jgi:hypothetical protein